MNDETITSELVPESAPSKEIISIRSRRTDFGQSKQSFLNKTNSGTIPNILVSFPKQHRNVCPFVFDITKYQWKGSFLLWFVRAGTSDFCSALAALVGPVQNIFFLTLHYYSSLDPIAQQAGQAAMLQLSWPDVSPRQHSSHQRLCGRSRLSSQPIP